MKSLNIKAKIFQVYPNYYLLPHNAIIQAGDIANAKQNFEYGWEKYPTYGWLSLEMIKSEWRGKPANYVNHAKGMDGKNLVWIRCKTRPLSLYETIKRISEIVDTSQNCSKGNEEIAVLAMDAVYNFRPKIS